MDLFVRSTFRYAVREEYNMTLPTTVAVCLSAALASAALAGCTKVSAGTAPVETRVAFSHALRVQNGPIRADVVEVTYAPGASSPPHTHGCPVVGYIIEGAIRTQSEGGGPATYVAGETFYESPNVTHLVSSNASSTRRARFLAYFTCGAHNRD